MDPSQWLSGAAGGAMMGSALGPWGAAIGGGLGLLGGIFGSQGSQSYQGQLQQLANQFGSRQAPQAGPATQAGASSLQGNQASLIAQLTSMAQGNGPSAAALQMRQATDQAAGAQASAAAGAGGRGVNAGAAMRQAMNNTAALQANNAAQTGMMRVQEQLGATNQLGNVINQGITAGNQLSEFNAGQSNQMSQANLSAQLQALGINTQAQLQALMGAAGVAGPGTGTQLLAGGASAMPGILGFLSRGQGGGGGGAGGAWPWQQAGWGGSGGTSSGPITSPSQI